MSQIEMSVSDHLLGDARMAELGDACEALLLGEEGKFDPERLDVRRKRFCQYLGIGDSTFTGWIQAGRIPRAAAIAIVLHRTLRQRQSRIRELTRERLEPRVVVMDGKFAICEFGESDRGEIEGRLVATGISDQAVAHDMARRRSRRFDNVVEHAIQMLRLFEESDPDQLERVGEIANELENYTRRRNQLATEVLDCKPTHDTAGKVGP